MINRIDSSFNYSNLVISGDYLQPAKVGITTKDIFTQIDEGQYIHFFDRVQYLKELSDMTTLRQELGLRTAFNTIEKLLNPSLSEYGVTTAFHKPYVQKYLDIFSSHFKRLFAAKIHKKSPCEPSFLLAGTSFSAICGICVES